MGERNGGEERGRGTGERKGERKGGEEVGEGALGGQCPYIVLWEHGITLQNLIVSGRH